jgi:hypothetical protein
MKNIEILRKEIVKDITEIPPFLDGNHLDIWVEVQIILRLISKLTNEKVLTQTKIRIISEQVNSRVDLLLEISRDINIDIHISNYIDKCIKKYLNFAINNELYEICQNIKNFKKLYLI